MRHGAGELHNFFSQCRNFFVYIIYQYDDDVLHHSHPRTERHFIHNETRRTINCKAKTHNTNTQPTSGGLFGKMSKSIADDIYLLQVVGKYIFLPVHIYIYLLHVERASRFGCQDSHLAILCLFGPSETDKGPVGLHIIIYGMVLGSRYSG